MLSTNIQARSDYPVLLASLQKLSQQEQQQHIRNLAKADLFFLLRYVCRRPDCDNDWVFDRCREVERNPDGCLDLWAREHYKSTIITFALTIQDILNNPEITVGIFSHTRPVAKAFLRQIKREFETNEYMQELFPDVLWENPTKDSPKWSENDGIIVKRKSNPKEATIEASGLVDGQPTSRHYDRLIYDDVVTIESVTSPEMIKKTTNAWEISLNLGSQGGSTRIIGTRYHFNDTYQTILDRGSAEPRVYPATLDGKADGEPRFMSKQALQKKYRDMGVYTFGCQMLQNPKADDAQGFKEEWLFFHLGVETLRHDRMNKMIIVDPANEKKETSDYTSAWVLGLSSDRNVYVLDFIRDRLNLTERADMVFRLHRKWRPYITAYEHYGMQADIQHIQSRMADEAYHFVITEVGGSMPKPDRIRRLVPWFENRRILIPERHHYVMRDMTSHDLTQVFIKQEYLPFPVCAHDDMLDSLARIEDVTLKFPEYETTDQIGLASKLLQPVEMADPLAAF